MSPFRPHGCPTWSIHAAAPAPLSGVVMDQTSTASWSTPGKWKSIRKFQKKGEDKCIDNYLYDIMLPPTSMEVENDHFTQESALRQIHFPLGPAFASSEMCLQSSPFTTSALSKCQSQRSWKCNLLKSLQWQTWRTIFNKSSAVDQLTTQTPYAQKWSFHSWPFGGPAFQEKLLNSASHSFRGLGKIPWHRIQIAVHFVLCLLVGFSVEGRISTQQSKPVTDGSGQESPGLNHLKSSLLDQERLQLGLKGWSPFGSNLSLVASIVSYHSQINWTQQSFITNPLSSSHDDSTTPNITRVIVVSLQHLTSWCWKTSQPGCKIY